MLTKSKKRSLKFKQRTKKKKWRANDLELQNQMYALCTAVFGKQKTAEMAMPSKEVITAVVILGRLRSWLLYTL